MLSLKRNSLVFVILGVLLMLSLSSCGAKSDDSTDGNATTANQNATVTATIKVNTKFGSATLDATLDDFQNAGFALGDSCDLVFSNGLKLNDVPFYNGYYAKTGDPLVIAYPKDEYVVVAYNNRSICSMEGIVDGDTVEIKLKEKAKFKTVQDSLSLSYSSDRSDFETDEQFSNFRALSGGNLKDNFLFRGASPYDNSRGRASITNKLVEEAQIRTVIDLADDAEELMGYFSKDGAGSVYSKKLMESGKIVALSLGADQDSETYKTSLGTGLRFLINNGGPAYIQCMEGKDRTGFACMLIEAFAGASYDEMKDDYMQTYANYYGITRNSDPEKYQAITSIYFDAFCQTFADEVGSDSLKDFDFKQAATSYIKKTGLSDEEINRLHLSIEK